jgi:RNA polymerase sigma-70 factor (ECF subfamily)
MHERPDELLVELSGQGDHDAYAELVHRHLKRVFAICLGLLGDLTDAEDAAQEVFVKGFQKLASLRDAGRFAPWIDQVARNRCRDLLRARRRNPERPLGSVVDSLPVAPGDDFSDLKGALARLPEEHRLPLMIYYFDGKDTTTLARELGLTQGGACARLHRARRQLRLLLEEVASHE